MRLRCGECGHDTFVAFICNRRGFCPSCGARRRSQTIAYLVNHGIFLVTARQWVLNVPIQRLLLLAGQPELVTPVLQRVQRLLERHLLDGAQREPDDSLGGAVTQIQRGGSAAHANIHGHCLVLDGLYRCGSDGVPTFVAVGARADDELHAPLQTILTLLMKLLLRQGVLIDDMGRTCLGESNGDGEGALRSQWLRCHIWSGAVGESLRAVDAFSAQTLGP